MDEVKSGLTFEQAKGMADRAIRDVKNGIVSAGYALKAIRSERLWEEQGFTSFDDLWSDATRRIRAGLPTASGCMKSLGSLPGRSRCQGCRQSIRSIPPAG